MSADDDSDDLYAGLDDIQPPAVPKEQQQNGEDNRSISAIQDNTAAIAQKQQQQQQQQQDDEKANLDHVHSAQKMRDLLASEDKTHQHPAGASVATGSTRTSTSDPLAAFWALASPLVPKLEHALECQKTACPESDLDYGHLTEQLKQIDQYCNPFFTFVQANRDVICSSRSARTSLEHVQTMVKNVNEMVNRNNALYNDWLGQNSDDDDDFEYVDETQQKNKNKQKKKRKKQHQEHRNSAQHSAQEERSDDDDSDYEYVEENESRRKRKKER